VKIYKDGVLAFSSEGLATGGDITPGGTFVIGQRQVERQGYFYNWGMIKGEVADIRIYEGLLSASEIWSIYDAVNPLPGDVDGDGDVDIFDLFAVASAFGTVQGDAGYNPDCDFDSDGDADINDLYTCGSNFGVGV